MNRRILPLLLAVACEHETAAVDEPTDCTAAPTIGHAACVLRECESVGINASECESILASVCETIDVDAAATLASDPSLDCPRE